MALSSRPNRFLDTLKAEHRTWLAGFDCQYLRNWEKLLKNNEESALTEAVVRRWLSMRGVTVSPNEDLTGNHQRPDFRCVTPGGQFYVEATCISVEKATEITGLLDGANTALRPSPLTKKIQRVCINKQRPKTRLGLPIFTLATDHAPRFCVVIVVMRSLRF